MGLFDFFKKKKNDNPYKDLPPAFQKAFAVLFPNGADDHEQQLNELYAHYRSKYERQEIDSNLIFILTGYLITGDTKTKEVAVSNVLARPKNRMTKSEVEYLLDYALNNHPKLKGLIVAEEMMDMLSTDGCTTDTIPGGVGMFGYSAHNPIPTEGVIGIYDYLSRLYDGEGVAVSYERTGTVDTSISEHPIDVYQVCSAAGVSTLYFSAYHKRTSQLSPSGYVLVDANNVILSNGGTKFSIGHKLSQETLDLPKLIGINSFACFSDKELFGKDERFIEAERINKRAIVLSNNGNFNNALELLDKAISMGSLNAVNNKFADLHTSERYKDGYEFLISTIDTEMETIKGLYNLAVLYYNGENDTNYNLKQDIHRSYNLLITATITPINNREENAESTLERVKELMTRLEGEHPSLLGIKNKRLSASKSPKIEENIEDTPTSSTEFKLQSSTPTIDVYGTPLIERSTDIYDSIHSASEEIVKQLEMLGLPKPSEKGMVELELLFAGILSIDIDKNIVLQSILGGNAEFKKLDLTNILLSIDLYRKQYETEIIHSHLTDRVPLLDFAKTHGRLKIGNLPRPDKYGNNKALFFVKSENDILVCHFGFWGENTHTPDFVAQNKNNILIDISKNGEHIFRLKSDIEQDMEEFMKYIVFYVYTSPLDFHNSLSSEEIEDAIKGIKRGDSKISLAYVEPGNPYLVNRTGILHYVKHALDEATDFFRDINHAKGFIGTFD